MIHVVTIENQHLYVRQLDQMFRMRYEFYVKERKWTNLCHANGRETDEYDNQYAVYLMYLDEYGDLVASVRMNPTKTGYLLDKLSHYVDGDLPRDDDTWDFTRWMIVPDARRKVKGEIAPVQREILCGIHEFALTRGIKAITCLTDTAFLERARNVFFFKPLGPAKRFEDGNGEAQAILIEAGAHALAHVRDRTSVYHSVLFEPTPKPAIDPEEIEKRNFIMAKLAPVDNEMLEIIRNEAAFLAAKLKSGELDRKASIDLIEGFTAKMKDLTEAATETKSVA